MFLRVEFPPHLGASNQVSPEPASGAHWVARHWLKLGSAGRAPGARAVYSVRAFRGFASRWAPRGLIGVLVASPRSANGR